MGRDQDATAASVVNQRAGVQLSPAASSDEIRLAIADLLDDDSYRRNASRLASVLSREHDALDVVLELEDLVGRAGPGAV
jgi:UDP:flavonoid glycosyltransferase YjiC (YdhE family)